MNSKKTNNQTIKDFLFALIKNKWALTSIIWLFIIIAIAIFASQLAPFDPNKKEKLIELFNQRKKYERSEF